MPTAWRQGDLVSPEHAIALGLITDTQAEQRLVVASHSCDIASAEDVEPEIELLRATVVSAQRASARNGHSIRKLHLPAHADETEWLELSIASRLFVQKSALFGAAPWGERSIPARERGILRRWLAQRYSRSEFPDAFVAWLQQSGVEERLDRWGKRYSLALVGIYFDLDDDTERTDADDPYELGVHLVYLTSDSKHETSSRAARDDLASIFKERCHIDGRWRWIELLYCDSVADRVFSLQAANEFRRWRFEHRSVAGEPVDETGLK